MHALFENLLASGPVVTDGAWGTQLQNLGLQPGECPDGWNLTHPDRVEQVARAYVEAGSHVILTNSFGANRVRLAESGLADKTTAINRQAVDISRRAAGNQARVFASIGPTGKMIASGDLTAEEARAAFLEQAQALAAAGADALVIETMSELDEALAALDAAQQTNLPVVACMVYDSGRDKDRTMMGITPEQAAQALTQAGANAIGANCGQGIEGFAPICRRLKQHTNRPVWIKANAGLPVMADGHITYPTTPEEFVSHVPKLIAAGASFLGGCCGTTPDFIKTLVRQVAAHPTA